MECIEQHVRPWLLRAALAPDALRAAWERVRDNDGCAGHDRQSLQDFERDLDVRLDRLRQDIDLCDYRPQPLQAVCIPKRGGGHRTLAIAAVRDRVAQTAVAQIIGPRLDAGFADCSFGYRPGRSVAMAVSRVVAHRDAGLREVVDADIECFFDRIDHALLMRRLRQALPGEEPLLRLIELWLAADLREPGALAPRLLERGVPQGSPLSPLLANLYLDPLDHALQERGLAVVRYADDLVILCPDAARAREALVSLRTDLAGLRLALNASKTRLTSFDDGFQFLGVRFVQRLVEPAQPGAAPWLLARPGPAARALESLDPAVDDASDAGADSIQAAAREPLLQTLYVTEPGALLTKENDRVVVSRRREILASVPLGQIDQIAVLDNALVSTALLRACAERRIAVAFSGRGGEIAAIERGALPDQALVAQQWEAQASADLRLLFARQFLQGKLHNSRTVLRRFTRRDGRDAVHEYLLGIDDCERRLATAPDLAVLRGLEGTAARHHFAAMRTLLPAGLDFPARHRRPPTDPVNVLLSYGYDLLAHNMHTLLRLAGLNPRLGHLHASTPGGLALVCDLVEEFRAPAVDAVVLTVLRQRAITPADFEDEGEHAERPCRLLSAPRRAFVAALESRLNAVFLHPRTGAPMDMRRAMQAQIAHYRRVLARDEACYLPLKFR